MNRPPSEFFHFSSDEKLIRTLVPLEIRREHAEDVFISAGAVFFPDRPRVGRVGWLDFEFLSQLKTGPTPRGITITYARNALLPSPVDRAESSFRRYYDAFLQNSLKGRRYRILLGGGEIAEGVPTAGSMVDPRSAPTFSFRTDAGERYRVPFAALVDAVPVDAVAAFLRERLRAAGSRDVLLRIPNDNAESLREADVGVVVVTAQWGSANVAPTQLLKYLTIQAAEYSVDELIPLAPLVLQLVVSPVEGDGPWG